MRKQTNGSRTDYSNPWKPARYGVAAIASFVVLLGAWGATAPLSGAVIANGSLQVEGRRQKVQHPYGGVVTAIHVREGQEVRRGDVVMTLSDTEPRARFDILRHNQQALLAEKSRLVAERDDRDRPTFPDGVTVDENGRQLVDSQMALLEARKRQYTASVDTIRQQIAQANEQSRGFEAEIEGLVRQVEIAEEDVASAQKLLQAGAVPRSRVLALQGRQSATQSELGSRRSDLAAMRERAGEGELKITQLERERVSEITARLQEVDTKLAELKPNLETAEDMLQRTEVKAPATGHIVGLSVFTQGGVVQQGASLMEIVPRDDPLFVDAKLKLSDITDVKTGQLADVRLVGVPRSMRPKIAAEIRTVSADSLADQRTGEGYYSVQLTLDRHDVDAARMALQPGMPVQVIVETQPRTLVSYLTGPLIDEVTGAFRER